jgi:hypothetical protein
VTRPTARRAANVVLVSASVAAVYVIFVDAVASPSGVAGHAHLARCKRPRVFAEPNAPGVGGISTARLT